MRAYSPTVVKVLYCLSLVALAGCVSSGAKAPGANAPCKTTDGCPSGYQCLPATTGASGLFCCKDKTSCGPAGSGVDGSAMDSGIVLDGPSSKGGAIDVAGNGGAGGIGIDSGNAGAGGSGGGIATGGTNGIDAPVTGGAGAGGADAPMATGGTSTGGATGSDARPLDVAAEVFAPDAPGTCSTDQDCPTLKPLCLANQCAKCASDSDCVGRSGPACSTSGLCVACTANSYCKGTAATCDTATSQCVGCTKRSDCSGTCQTCSASVCVAVKSQDDPTVCTGTCDSTGACKSKQGQACTISTDCLNGLSCADGYCCNRACTGTCEACDVGTSVGTCTTLGANATPRAGRTACVATDATCAGKCDGNSAACAYASSTTSCGTASCTNGAFTTTGSCSGAGACSSGSTGNCGAYACVSTTSSSCKSSCTTKSDCVSGYTCSSQTCVPPDTTPPTVTRVSPSNGTQGVNSDSTIVVTFSEAMDQTSVRSALSISGLLSADLGLAWDGTGTTVTITPKNGLAYSSGTSPSTTTARTYTITVGTGATDLAGNALTSSYSSSFTTLRQITQTVSPTVSAHYFDGPLTESVGNTGGFG